MKPNVLIVAALAAAFAAWAAGASAQGRSGPVEDTAFGLGKGSVFDTPTPKPFAFEGEGAGKIIPPPPGMPVMIPHPIEAYLPLTIDRNACLGCHDRPSDVGKKLAKGAARPAPSNHYVLKDGKRVLSGAQYNCTSCHAPQAGVDALVGNPSSPTR
jgi:cytochrome c-type protein NapB